jgi:probable DNA metabolism protein
MKTSSIVLSFDGNFEGFLSAVYTALSEKLEVIDLRPGSANSTPLFHEVRYIPADGQKARAIWDALSHKGTSDLKLVYFSFLTENEQLFLPIYEYISLLIRSDISQSSETLPGLRAKLAPWAQRVEREKQKLEASLRLQSGPGEFRCCRLRPVYDVLPLLTRYCRLHFGPDPWMLIDAKRRYGLRNTKAVIERFPLTTALSGSTGAALTPQPVRPLQAAV